MVVCDSDHWSVLEALCTSGVITESATLEKGFQGVYQSRPSSFSTGTVMRLWKIWVESGARMTRRMVLSRVDETLLTCSRKLVT